MVKKNDIEVRFPTHPSSPFADRFDLDAARAAIAHLLQADPAQIAADPAYPLFVEYEKRVRMLEQMRETHRIRFEANAEVPTREAAKLGQVGDLESEDEDTILLHTRHAMRALIGRTNAPGQKGLGIAGGWKAAAALKALWHLSAGDNPYADWALVQLMDLHVEVMDALQRQCDSALKVLEGLKARGMSYAVLRSAQPVKVSIEFRSPYGYAIAELVAQFDTFVRLVKTLRNRGQLSDREEDEKLHAMRKRLRDLFERAVRLERYLRNEKLRQLSRADWLPTADEAAKLRVAGAIALMGEIPRAVFDGSKAPRYTKRRVVLTESELRLLRTLPLDAAATSGRFESAQALEPELQARLM
jgi:integrating conjugative element protein (TIGR03761 family)